MVRRIHIVSLLALALLSPLLLAGCLSAGDDLGSQDTVTPEADTGRVLSNATFGLKNVDAEMTLDVPADVGGLFVSHETTATGLGNTFRLFAEGPDGKAYTLVSGSVMGMSAKRTGWSVLPGLEGTWKFKLESKDPSSTTLDVTLLAKRATPAPVAGNGPDRVVVGIVDTGVNPYHEVFQRPNLTTDQLPARIVEAASGQHPLSLRMSRGEDYLDTVKLDAGLWAQVPAQTLVHFSGTNVLGYHLDETTLPALPVLDRAGHGTAVSHSVTNENPEVLIVMITGNDYDAGVAWAAEQPWIDLISLSWGPPVNAAGPAMDKMGFFVTPEVTKAAYSAGKVVFTASGNDPTPTFSDTTSGPVWAHAVSGSHGKSHSRATLSGNFVDTVANWTQTLALSNSLDDVRSTSGTSFATPTTAGIASRILHEVRTAAGHVGGITEGALVKTGNLTVTNKDLRDALNASAVYWSTLQYGGPTDPGPSIPVAPAPWVSMGWGHLDGSAVPVAVNGLLGIEELPQKPAAAKMWMDAQLRLRAMSWGS